MALIALVLVGFFHLLMASPLADGEATALCAMIESVQGLPAAWQCPNKDTAKNACDAGWTGLTCSNPRNTTASVTGLDLTGLSGVLPDELGMLSELRTLKLSGTGLKGPLPLTLSNLRHMVTLDISGSSISAGCFPQSWINNEIFSTCRTPDSSFSCSCDAPLMCRAKTCCPSVGGLEEAGLSCKNGEWEVISGKTITIDNFFLQEESISIGTDMNVTGHFELRRGSLRLDGNLAITADEVVIAGLSSNLTISGCLQINDGVTTLILQLLEEDSVTPDLEWTFVKAKDDCIIGEWKEIVFQTISYDGCLKTDTQNVTHPGSVILNVAGECSSGLSKEAILGIVFGLLVGAFLIGVVVYIFNNQEAYEHVFPDRIYKPISNPENF